MTKSVLFSDVRPRGIPAPATPVSNAPYAEVKVFGAMHRTPRKVIRLWAMLDTGADEMMVPTSVATKLGLALPSVATSFSTAGGGTGSAFLVHGATVDIEGIGAIVDCYFASASGFTPLLGRNGLMTAMKTVGLDSIDWMFER